MNTSSLTTRIAPRRRSGALKGKPAVKQIVLKGTGVGGEIDRGLWAALPELEVRVCEERTA